LGYPRIIYKENGFDRNNCCNTSSILPVWTILRRRRQIPHVFRIYTREQLPRGMVPDDIVGRRVMKSYSEQRGADLYVLLEPYYLTVPGSTNHGSAFGYDTHVPLIFMGAGIKAGRFHGSVAINDVAPTLATLVGVEIPSGAEGRILHEMFMIP